MFTRVWAVEQLFYIFQYKCVVIGCCNGRRSGYVGIPPEDPAAPLIQINPQYVSAHGSITYISTNQYFPILQIDPLIWIGFDCCHAFDGIDLDLVNRLEHDPYLKIMHLQMHEQLHNIYTRFGNSPWKLEVRTTEFVARECLFIALQLFDLSIASILMQPRLSDGDTQ